VSRQFKDNHCVITLDEHSKLALVRGQVLNAFKQGVVRFQFILKFKSRTFRDCVALPADADEECALELADTYFKRFTNTVAQLLTKKL